jgi:WD40-like Beta Propeller Repeat
VRSAGRVALVVAAVVVGAAALVIVNGKSDSIGWLLLGPPLLAVLVALVAGRAWLLGVAAATFVTVGIAWLATMDPGYVSEGGGAVPVWFILSGVVALYATAGVRLLISRLRRGGWPPPRRLVAACGAVVGVGVLVATVILLRGGGQSASDSAGDSPSDRRASAREAERLIRQARHLHLGGRITFAVPTVGDRPTPVVMTMNADGSALRRILPGTRNLTVDGLAGTPDGSRIAFWHGNDVYAMDARGQGVKRIAHFASISDPAWSRDRKWVAFGRKASCSEVNGQVVAPCQQHGDGIYVATIDGSVERLLAATDDGTDAPSWGPDERIVYADLEGRLWVGHLYGAEVFPFTDGTPPDQQPAWSPDGRFIATNCGPVDGGSLCLITADSAAHRRTLVTLGVSAFSWSPDGRWILFLAYGNDPQSRDGLWVIRRDGANLTQIVPWRQFVSGVGWVIPEVVLPELMWTRS